MAEIKFAFDVKNNTIFINAFHNILVDSHSKAYKKITGILEFILDQAIHKKCDTQVEAIEQVLYCPKCDDVVKESDLK